MDHKEIFKNNFPCIEQNIRYVICTVSFVLAGITFV
jgi:hypothetical protein